MYTPPKIHSLGCSWYPMFLRKVTPPPKKKAKKKQTLMYSRRGKYNTFVKEAKNLLQDCLTSKEPDTTPARATCHMGCTSMSHRYSRLQTALYNTPPPPLPPRHHPQLPSHRLPGWTTQQKSFIGEEQSWFHCSQAWWRRKTWKNWDYLVWRIKNRLDLITILKCKRFVLKRKAMKCSPCPLGSNVFKLQWSRLGSIL